MAHRPAPRRAALALILTTLLLSAAPGIVAAAGELTTEQRIGCTLAIEQVRWQQREWPQSNPGPKPALAEVLSEATLERKALEPLLLSAALEEVWRRPLTAEQLQAEIDRMAAGSRRPAVLEELFDALGRDPYRVAECLARPLLAERLARSWYESDERFHGELRRRAEADLAAVGSPADLAGVSGDYRELEWIAEADEAAAVTERGAIELEGDRWQRLLERLTGLVAGDAAAGAALPPAGVAPLQEDDRRLWTVAVLEARSGYLRAGVAEWPKETFDGWWERRREELAPADARIADHAHAFRLPAVSAGAGAGEGLEDDTWEAIPSLPDARDSHAAVWTGNEMLIWGGNLLVFATGGRYDPATDTWLPISIAGEPVSRTGFTGVWSGSELIVWGGWGGGTADNTLASGGRYDPLSDSWAATSTTGAPAGRWLHTAVWTGDEMVVWGGCTALICGSLGSGGRYDPATDSWSPTTLTGAPAARGEHTAVWSGIEMIVWGGEGAAGFLSSGGRYDPVSDSWDPTSTVGAPAGRAVHTAVWSGDEMIVWGGVNGPHLDSGGRYHPATDSWQATTGTGAPEGRRLHTAVWAGDVMVVWGGCVDSQCSNHRSTGGRYDPATDTWSPTSTFNDPSARSRHSAIWTGSEMIVWGGCTVGECQVELSSGGRYDPASDSWVPTGSPGEPSPRILHTAVWTGSEMIVWGGLDEIDQTLTGRRYDPATDVWTPTDIDGTAGARDSHSAIWTGSEMIVWGGVLRGIGTTRSGARYDPVSDSWQSIESSTAPEARMLHTAVWSGGEMIVWGGCRFQGCSSFWNSGGRYDPATDSWTLTALGGAPGARFDHRAVWTGDLMIVWGGSDGTPLDTGGRYDPATDTWADTRTSPSPSPRRSLAAVWTGSEMIVWGGTNDVGVLDDGGLYDPVGDSWRRVAFAGAPEARRGHTAVWTGGEMVVWGGCADPDCLAFGGSEFLRSGGRYDPAADLWSPTSTLAAPFGRNLHTAVWSGEQMLVWGGWRGSTGLFTDTGAAYTALAAAAEPDIEAAPEPLLFDDVPVGTTDSRAVTLSNVGGGELQIDRISNLSAPFAIADDGCTGALLGPGESCDIVVDFSPTAEGIFRRLVRIASNDPDEPRIRVRIAGRAVTP